MQTSLMRWLIGGLVVLLLLGVTFVVLWEGPGLMTGGGHGDAGRDAAGQAPRVPPPELGAVPDFAFVERSGRTVTRADLGGQPWIVDFIFTRCHGTCPLLSSRMFGIQDSLSAASPVRLVSVSVDPEYDTPEVLSRYAERFKADPERWLFLTGERDTIYEWIRGGFRLGVEEADAAARAGGAEDFIHSTRLVLVDAHGQIRGYYDAVRAESVGALLGDLEMVLAEPAS
jgi:cytochrome oxidase Cu insertion factor (SCO1/SenC/PrrC family)